MLFGVYWGMPEEGLMFTYRLMPLMQTGTGGEELLFGVCRGVCQRRGLCSTYRLMPLMRQGQEEGDCCFGVCRGKPEEGENDDG